MPKRVKHRKEHRGQIKGKASQGNTVAFGEFGLQALEPGWLNGRQIEAGRVAASHFLKQAGRVYIRVFPHKPVTVTPQETRMGKGKGEPEFYVATVKPGTIIYEIGGTSGSIAKQALNRVAHKLPFRVKFVQRSYL